MNSVLRIQVRVNSGPATAEIKQIQAALAQMAASVAKATAAMDAVSKRANRAYGAVNSASVRAAGGVNKFGAGVMTAHQRLEKFGKNLQWSGRQIEYNFTLPILLAGAAAFKFAMDQEKAFTRIKKVYGDQIGMTRALMEQNKGLTEEMAQQQATDIFRSELDALSDAFRALSDRYGVARAEVNAIAADWAAAGASGVALAKGVQASLDAMILGEMDAKTATESLIAIQAQYGLSSEQLAEALAILNQVENATGASLVGLVQGFTRSAASARTAGVGVRELAAFMAALTPATGSATNAGNALKTIFSRILAPTEEAARVMELMGVNVKGVAWQSKTGSERLLELAKRFEGLSSAQQAVVSSTIASRFQVSRFDQLMRALTTDTSYYYAALKATSDKTYVLQQKVRELNAVLESNPKKFEIIKTRIQNLMADAIIPLLPSILGVMKSVADLLKGFSNLDPTLQKIIMTALLGVAAFGTLARLLGASAIFVGYVTGAFLRFGKVLFFLPIALGKFGASVTKSGGMVARTMKSSILPAIRTVWGFYVKAFVDMAAQTYLWAARAATAVWTWAASVTRASAVAAAGQARTWIAGLVTSLRSTVAWGGYMVATWVTTHMRMLAASRVGLALQAGMWLGGLRVILVGAIAWAGRMIATQTAMLVAWLARTRIAMMIQAMLWLGGWKAVLRGLGVLMLGGLKTLIAGILSIWRVGIVTLLRFVIAGLLAVFTSPWGLAIAAAVLIFVAFRDKISAVVKNIVDRMAQIIPAFGSIMRGLAQLLAKAIQKIREILSYLNPFARHSPSLVDNVRAGMKVIAAEYSKLGGVLGAYNGLIAATQRFTRATRDAVAALEAKERAEQRAAVVAAAGASAGRAYDDMVAAIKRAEVELAKLKTAMDNQQAVVDNAEAALKALDTQLDAATNKLQALEAAAAAIKDEMDAANQAIQDFANAPLAGLDALEDEIWSNEVAQKQLQYAMMGIEDAIGPIDEVRNKMAMMQGEIEGLRGTQEDLRQAGAGGDILKVYDDEINRIGEQQDAVMDQVKAYSSLEGELAQLQREAEKLDLEKFLNFETLQHQIEELIDTRQELTFDEIVNGIQGEQAKLVALGAQYDQATAAVREQQKVVDSLTAARDAARATYDAEKAKLDQIKASYDAMAQAVEDAKNQLDQFVSSAKAASDAAGNLSPAEQNFANAAGGDWADPGSDFGVGRDSFTDETAQIEAFTQGVMDDIEKQFGDMDIFGPFKDAWNGAMEWLRQNTPQGIKDFVNNLTSNLGQTLAGAGIGTLIGMWFGPAGAIIGGIMGAAIAGMIPPEALEAAGNTVKGWLDGLVGWLQGAWDKIVGAAKFAWGMIGDPIIEFGKMIWGFLVDLVDKIKEKFASWGDIIEPLKGAISNIGKLLGVIGGIILAAFRVVLPIITHTLKPVLDFIVTLVGSIIDVIHGIILFITGIFSGDWSAAWEGIKLIFGGIWDTIVGLFKAIPGTIIGIVRGFIDGVIGLFQWLWDVLVGHSIIPDMIRAIIDWFISLPGKVISAVGTLVSKLVSWAWDMFKKLVSAVASAAVAYFQFWLELPGKILGFLANLGQMLWDWMTAAWGKVSEAAATAFTTFVGWIITVPQKIIDGLINLGQMLWDWITAAWQKISDGANFVWDTFYEWVTGLPAKVINGWITLGTLLYNWIKGAWEKIKTGASEKFTAFITWVTGLPQKVINGWIALGTKLYEWIRGAWQRIRDGAGEKFSAMYEWVTSLPGKIVSGVTSLGGKLYEWVRGAWQRIRDGAGEKFETLMSWVRGIPGAILSALGNMGSLLYNAGKNILQGLFDGMKKVFEDVKNFVMGIGSWISDHKGPKAYDLALLVPAGGWIMEGLNKGLDGGMGDLKKQVEEISNVVSLSDTKFGARSFQLGSDITARLGEQANKWGGSSTVSNTNQSTTTQIIIQGDLSFPNIDNSADAEAFVKNLQALAGR